MKTVLIAIGWAAALILLPLLARTGLSDAATLAGLAPLLTVLAVLHITARSGGSRCRIGQQRGAS